MRKISLGIKYLMSNTTAYFEYFKWTNYFTGKLFSETMILGVHTHFSTKFSDYFYKRQCRRNEIKSSGAKFQKMLKDKQKPCNHR